MKRTEPKGALPGSFLRLCWLIRVLTPLFPLAPLLWHVFDSVSSIDFEYWATIPWTQLLDDDGVKRIDVDLFAQNLITPNAVTKTLFATAIVLFAIYVTDLRTTGRRQGWHLVGHPMNSSRFREFLVWMLLFMVFATIISGVVTLRVKELCKPTSALVFVLIAYTVVLFTLVITNRNFNAYLLLVPTIDARRKQIRAERMARRKERQQQRKAQQLEAKRERDRIRAKRTEIVELQEACREIDASVAYLESSGEPQHLIDEELAELKLRRGELEDQIERLTVELS